MTATDHRPPSGRDGPDTGQAATGGVRGGRDPRGPRDPRDPRDPRETAAEREQRVERDPRDAPEKRDPFGLSRAGSFAAPAAAALGLVVIGWLTLALLTGNVRLPGSGNGNLGGAIPTAAPSNVVIVDPRVNLRLTRPDAVDVPGGELRD